MLVMQPAICLSGGLTLAALLLRLCRGAEAPLLTGGQLVGF